MKKIFFALIILFPLFANAQSGTAIFNIADDGTIITNNKFRDSLPSERSSFSSWILSQKVELSDSLIVKLPSSSCTIKIGKFERRDNDLGNYDVIEIYKNGKQLVSFRELETIVKYEDNKHTDNGYFITVPLSDSTKALICEGFHYGAGLPRLMIFVLTESDAKLVYYKYEYIKAITNKLDNFSMIVMSQFAEWISPDVIGTAEVNHTIWNKNGILKFRNN